MNCLQAFQTLVFFLSSNTTHTHTHTHTQSNVRYQHLKYKELNINFGQVYAKRDVVAEKKEQYSGLVFLTI